MTLESVPQQLRVDSSFFNAIAPHWLQSLQDFPAQPPRFLETAYLRTYVPHTDLPVEALPLLEAMAATVTRDPALLRLAWHAHRQFARYPDVVRFREWPSLDEYHDGRGRLFYLPIVCSALDQYRNKIRDMKMPDSYYMAGCQQIRGFYESYAVSHQRPGIGARHIPWMRNHLDGTLFRVGRFEYDRHGQPIQRHRLPPSRHWRSAGRQRPANPAVQRTGAHPLSR